jgi:DNA-binding XRE family transcriptional regulator
VKMGRPSKYRPEMCTTVVDLMREGASIAEVCAELGIHKDTFYKWEKDPEKPEFTDSVKTGRVLSEAWWTRAGRENLYESKFNHGLWYMNMKNRFGWRDKQEVEHSGKVEGKLVIVRPQD